MGYLLEWWWAWKDSTGRSDKQCQCNRGWVASWFPLISFRPHLPALPTPQGCWRGAICPMSPISVSFKHWCRSSCCRQHSQSCRRQFSNTWGLESCPGHHPVLFREVRVLCIGAASAKMHWNHTVLQLPSRVWLFATPWTAAHQASLFLTISWSFLPHGLQHTRLPCPSPSPGVCSNSCPLSQWCYLTISSSVTLFSFCLQSFPASGSFPMSRLFTSGGQSIGASASASVLPMNIQGWFLLELTGLISLKFKGLSRVFSKTTVWKHQFSGTQPSLWSNSHIHTWLLEK